MSLNSLNKVTLIGNVGKDPEIRSTQQGSKIASFSLATTVKWKDKTTNEWKQKSEWHKVVVYNENIVGSIDKYVVKGSTLYIEGELKYSEYENKQGQKVNKTEIVLQGYNCCLKILDKKDDNAEEKKPVKKSSSKKQEVEEEDDFEEVPF